MSEPENPSRNGVDSRYTDNSEGVAVLNILDLNEDCLHQMFNSKYVSVMDLALVAQSCVKLKRIATQIFNTKYAMCNLNNDAVEDFIMAERLLETFGSLISDLLIDFTPYGLDGAKIVDAILRCCENLKSLAMTSYKIPDTRDDIMKITSLFGKVEVLHINDVNIEDPGGRPFDDFVTVNGYVMDIFEDCNSLIDLKIDNCEQLELVAFGNKFPKLEHICYEYAGDDVGTGLLNDTAIHGFILRHRHLKSFKLSEPYRCCFQALSMIPVYCKELEKLEFRSEPIPNSSLNLFSFWLEPLGRLDRLKELKIVCCGQRVTEMLKEFQQSKSLNILHLESVEGGRDFLESLSGIKPLRSVKLVDVKLDSLSILTQLTELTELFVEPKAGKIGSGFDITQFVDKLVNLRKLKIHFKNYSISESEYVRLTDVGECRVGTDRYLELDCHTTGDFTNSIRRSVQFKTFDQSAGL